MEEEERATEEVKTAKEEGLRNKERPPEEEANGALNNGLKKGNTFHMKLSIRL